MRTQLFRTDPVLINGASVVVLRKDLDGVDPVTLFIENVDIAASGRTKFGSKNANLRFVAVSAGTSGNARSVIFHAAASQAFSIAVGAYDITVNLKCDASGKPVQQAFEIMDLMNLDGPTVAVIRTVLAKGSDGSATMEVVVGTDVTVDLAGGFTATTLGAVTIEISPTGVAEAPGGGLDFQGPWFTDAAAGTALSTVAAGAVKTYVLRSGNTIGDAPVKGLRITAAKGVANTTIVVSAIVTKKGGGVS